MNRLAVAVLVLASSIITACTNHNQIPVEIVDPDSIYFDYLAWGDEESGMITLKLQYRAGSRNKHAVLLKDPARVEFDGQVLLPDSTGFAGPYYEVIRQVDEFAGMHSIVFTDVNKKRYTTEFEFPVISLKDRIDTIVARRNLVLRFNNLRVKDKLRILLTDTSFYGSGIEKVEMMLTDSVVITRSDLHALKNGPVYMEIFREEDKFLQETMASGGRFYLTYGLKREFNLQDSVR